jgi:hypothetical protein
MNREWQKSARQARSALAESRHGGREAALKTVFHESGWKDVNTVRRAVFALDYLDELERTHPRHYAYVCHAPLSVIEALARLHRLDQIAARQAASDWSSGKESLSTLRDKAKGAQPVGLGGRTGQFLEDEYRRLAEKRVRTAVQRIIGARVSAPHLNYKSTSEAPTIDYLYSSTTKTSRLRPKTIAVLIVGPYQNRTLYRRRRFDWMLKAFGLAWFYDYVVLVLPAKKNLEDYNPWIFRYRESAVKRQLSDPIPIKAELQITGRRPPRIHAISVEIPIFDTEDEDALETLAT